MSIRSTTEPLTRMGRPRTVSPVIVTMRLWRMSTAIAGAAPGGGGRGGGAAAAAPETLASAAASLAGLVNSLGSADVQPTANQLSAISAARAAAARVMTRWRAIDTVELATLNATLKSAGIEPIK